MTLNRKSVFVIALFMLATVSSNAKASNDVKHRDLTQAELLLACPDHSYVAPGASSSTNPEPTTTAAATEPTGFDPSTAHSGSSVPNPVSTVAIAIPQQKTVDVTPTAADGLTVPPVNYVQVISEAFNQFPSGSHMNSSEFSKRLPQRTCMLFVKSGITSITNKNGHIELAMVSDLEKRINKKANLKFHKSISFDALKDPSGKLLFTNIIGLQVYVSFFLGGWNDITGLTVYADQAGNTVFVVGVNTVWAHVDYTAKIGPDGKPIKK